MFDHGLMVSELALASPPVPAQVTVQQLRDRIRGMQDGVPRLPVPTPPALGELLQLRTGSTYEVDRETLTRAGNSVTFWLKVHYGPDAPPGESDGYLARRKVNCTDHSYQDLQTDYMKDGKVLRSSGVEEMMYAKPDTIADSVVESACRG